MTTDLKTQLMEKYLHSQGAALHEEGRLDEAIIFLEQAVALRDRSYTRCQLGLVFLEKNNVHRALQEMDRAIALNPLIARYHYEKSCLHQLGGNRSEAQLAFQKAIDIDGNYARIDEIREALKVLEEVASPQSMIEWLPEGASDDPVITEMATLCEKDSGLAVEGLDTVSCTLPCPAFCCHFEGSPVLHGLTIGPWKLLKIREFLREKGLEEDQFLDKLDLTGETEIQRLIPPHHLLRERGHSCVYSPKKGGSRLNPTLLASLPKGRGYQDLIWIHEDSSECSFLRNRKCMIHDVGEEPALPACKEFLCLTGFVFALLTHWGLIDEDAVEGKTMAQLNHLAVEAALIVSRELCRAEDMGRTKASMEVVASTAFSAKGKGASEDRDQTLYLADRIRTLHDELMKVIAARKASCRRQIEGLMNASPDRL
jgi:hypothetical protein